MGIDLRTTVPDTSFTLSLSLSKQNDPALPAQSEKAVVTFNNLPT